MFQALTRSVKQFLTAVVLLLFAIVALELMLQFKNEAPVETISECASSNLQTLLTPSAVTHHEMRRLFQQQTPDSGLTISTNSFGLRGKQPVDPKPASVLRILILGDETILGPNLPAPETVSARLETFLQSATGRPIEVLNAGVPGFSPLLSWLQFQHELKKLQPDVVILHFDMTDVADDSIYRSMLRDAGDQQLCANAMLMANRDSANPFFRLVRNSSVCQLLKSKSGILPAGNSVADISQLVRRYEWTTTTTTNLRLAIQHALSPIERFKHDAERQHYQLVVSTSPVPWQVTSLGDFPTLSARMAAKANWPETTDIPFRILKAACAQDAIPFCNAADAFRRFSQPSKLFQPDGLELSKYGALLYAREIASMLINSPQVAGLFSNPSASNRPPGNAR